MNLVEPALEAPSPLLWGVVTLAWGLAFLSVVVGRNLTRSITAAVAALFALAFLFFTTLSRMPTGLALSSGVGLGAIVALVVATLVLMLVQLFGWMLVDVDRDHLPPTDRGTWLARSLAFLIVGGALVLLGRGLSAAFARTSAAVPEILASVEGPPALSTVRDFAILAGLVLASALLASLMLLREDGEER
jgi:hypothetical protein